MTYVLSQEYSGKTARAVCSMIAMKAISDGKKNVAIMFSSLYFCKSSKGPNAEKVIATPLDASYHVFFIGSGTL